MRSTLDEHAKSYLEELLRNCRQINHTDNDVHGNSPVVIVRCETHTHHMRVSIALYWLHCCSATAPTVIVFAHKAVCRCHKWRIKSRPNWATSPSSQERYDSAVMTHVHHDCSSMSFLGRIANARAAKRRPVATDVTWSVCVSVCWTQPWAAPFVKILWPLVKFLFESVRAARDKFLGPQNSGVTIIFGPPAGVILWNTGTQSNNSLDA